MSPSMKNRLGFSHIFKGEQRKGKKKAFITTIFFSKTLQVFFERKQNAVLRTTLSNLLRAQTSEIFWSCHQR